MERPLGNRTGHVELILQMRNNDYQTFHQTARTDLESPCDRFDVLVAVFGKLFLRCYVPSLMVVRMHLLAMALEPSDTAQRGLFDPPEEPARTLASTKHTIKREVYRFAVRSGATLPLKDWYDDPALGVEAVAPQRTVY